MSKFDEMILVVNRKDLFNDEAHAFNGFLSQSDARFNEITKTLDDYEIKRRGDMEEDESYKQLVSYTIVESDHETLVYKRLTGGGESRLHGLHSIGVGGHMNDIESEENIKEKMFENAARELQEEIGLEKEDLNAFELIGLINDDTNEVGRVHIGLVFKVNVDKEKVFTNEEDTLQLIWSKREELKELGNYETWSELIIRDLYE
ncbi:NUDIX domain-containing protein [Nosocomiicoccus massiliensis]|uniref:NUDIX domain-containing protein n=1 Tax=Nosocomiicoccus massiliensis TaxID=1232430 RepID=UPI00040740F0|nr:NUDIX domain-containing protein [Nosocomiicoccus massiliensis]